MIISASRRTDIPAFYSKEFMAYVRKGMVNVKNAGLVSLQSEAVDCFVFWTKDAAPMLRYTEELTKLGYQYYFQFTINNYPVQLEPKVPELAYRLQTFKMLSQEIGPERVIWRYDPIVVTEQYPLGWHLDQIAYIAKELEGHTRRLVISFLDTYGKVKERIDQLGIKVCDVGKMVTENPGPIGKVATFCDRLLNIAKLRGMEVYSCAEMLGNYGIQPGACIDGDYINRMFRLNINHRKDKTQRQICRCDESIDIGTYHTCKHGCVYCYGM